MNTFTKTIDGEIGSKQWLVQSNDMSLRENQRCLVTKANGYQVEVILKKMAWHDDDNGFKHWTYEYAFTPALAIPSKDAKESISSPISVQVDTNAASDTPKRIQQGFHKPVARNGIPVRVYKTRKDIGIKRGPNKRTLAKRAQQQETNEALPQPITYEPNDIESITDEIIGFIDYDCNLLHNKNTVMRVDFDWFAFNLRVTRLANKWSAGNAEMTETIRKLLFGINWFYTDPNKLLFKTAIDKIEDIVGKLLPYIFAHYSAPFSKTALLACATRIHKPLRNLLADEMAYTYAIKRDFIGGQIDVWNSNRKQINDLASRNTIQTIINSPERIMQTITEWDEALNKLDMQIRDRIIAYIKQQKEEIEPNDSPYEFYTYVTIHNKQQ